MFPNVLFKYTKIYGYNILLCMKTNNQSCLIYIHTLTLILAHAFKINVASDYWCLHLCIATITPEDGRVADESWL